MTAIERVKRKLWTYQYKVTDMTEHRFVNAYDLVVEGIYRVAVRELPSVGLIPIQVDVLALVEKGKITFYKDPFLFRGKLFGEVVDSSPINIFIKHEKKHTTKSNSGKSRKDTRATGDILRRKTIGTAKSGRRNKSAK